MASQLTLDNAMVNTHTQNQARLARAQRLFEAARHLTGIRSEKTRLDRLLDLAERICGGPSKRRCGLLVSPVGGYW